MLHCIYNEFYILILLRLCRMKVPCCLYQQQHWLFMILYGPMTAYWRGFSQVVTSNMLHWQWQGILDRAATGDARKWPFVCECVMNINWPWVKLQVQRVGSGHAGEDKSSSAKWHQSVDGSSQNIHYCYVALVHMGVSYSELCASNSWRSMWPDVQKCINSWT